MATIQETNRQPGKLKRHYNKRSVHVDMTPLVDLAFLLLTFFVLTATFARLKSMTYTEPDNSGEPTKIKNGITFLLGEDNRVFCYEGEFKASGIGNTATQLNELSFDKNAANSLYTYLLNKSTPMLQQLERLIVQKKAGNLTEAAFVQQVNLVKKHPDTYTFLIKPNEQATYANVVAVLNALNIHLAGKYFIQEIAFTENTLLKQKTRTAR